jgi:hypothetical protein
VRLQRTFNKQTKKNNMKNQTKPNYATLHFAIDDLQLLQDALTALQLRRTNIGYGKKDDIDRLYHAISLAIYDDVSTANSESVLMNS